MTVEFCDPPPVRRERPPSVIGPIIEALKERPGEWAKVWSTTAGKGTNGSSPIVARLKKRGAEATSRKTETGSAVWARWPEDGAA